jgi:ATP-dependent exoDNAse (exonuclease V) beta subunit
VESPAPVASLEAGLIGSTGTLTQLPDLLAPVEIISPAEIDEKLKARESDPPARVWRVVSKTSYDVPAWVIGSLTHVALRYWRFPDSRDPSTELCVVSLWDRTGFTNFLRPFALEAGLTDTATIDSAISRVSRLLTRFQAHPLYAQLSTAERHHELPYTVAVDGQVQSGIIDLLFRTSPTAVWTIAEFKTDRLPEGADLRQYAQQKGYDRQVAAYRQAISQQLGATPQILVVYLNVGQSVQVLEADA